MKVLASVIIPNWNGQAHLKVCLESLQQQTFKNFEVIVVDNNSSDNSVEYIKKTFPEVKLVLLNKNYGFAKAINAGVGNSTAKYVVFLNNDTKADKLWLKNLINTAQKNPGIASVGSKLLNFYNPKIIDGVGIKINEVGQALSLGWQEEDVGQYEKEMFIFGATAGAALFDREIFNKVGGLDEHYFMYFEEVDWAWRAQFLGFKSIYCPKAVVYHKHKASAKKRPSHIEYWQFKNMTQTLIKDMPWGLVKKNNRLLKIILVHLNTILYQLKNGYLWPPVMTELSLLLNLPRLILARYKIQSHKKVSDQYLEPFLYEKKITWWGFLK